MTNASKFFYNKLNIVSKSPGARQSHGADGIMWADDRRTNLTSKCDLDLQDTYLGVACDVSACCSEHLRQTFSKFPNV